MTSIGISHPMIVEMAGDDRSGELPVSAVVGMVTGPQVAVLVGDARKMHDAMQVVVLQAGHDGLHIGDRTPPHRRG